MTDSFKRQVFSDLTSKFGKGLSATEKLELAQYVWDNLLIAHELGQKEASL